MSHAYQKNLEKKSRNCVFILTNFLFDFIAIKRQSVDDLGEDRRQVLNEVSQLITGGNMQMQMVGCSILSALMAEYATTVKSSDVGLAWEIHFKAKKQFELTDLKSIFQFCVQALKELTPTLSSPIPPERSNLVLRLTTLAESILSWSFVGTSWHLLTTRHCLGPTSAHVTTTGHLV